MWNFHVITLREYPQRTEKVKNILDAKKIPYTLHYFSKHKDPWKGCLNSHLFMYEYASQNNLDWIIIVEDNIKDIGRDWFGKEYDQLREIVLQNPLNWDVILFGGNIFPFNTCYSSKYDRLYQIYCCQGMVSYIISKKGYRSILDKKNEINEPLDTYIPKRLQQYIYKPLLFYRDTNVSSVISPGFDLPRKLWFNPKFQRFAELLFFLGLFRTFCVGIIILIVCILFKHLFLSKK